MQFSINSIYRATEGEGIWLGCPQVFIRFQGCHIGCLNCDSKDTWESSNQFMMSFNVLKQKVEEETLQGRIKRLSITGGDPLHPKFKEQVLEIVRYYKPLDYWINIEAAGTRVDEEIFNELDYISYDIKTPSTGVKTSKPLLEKMFKLYSDKFQIKAVIESREDFDYVHNIRNEMNNASAPWIMTPAYNLNEKFPEKRFLEVISWNEEIGGLFRVVGQQHKFLHGPNKKNI